MSQFSGMEPDQIRVVGRGLKARSNQIGQLIGSIDTLANEMGSRWQGLDSQRFRGWWESEHRPALARLGEAIDGLGQAALNNADEQEGASGGNVTAVDTNLAPFRFPHGDPPTQEDINTLLRNGLSVTDLVAAFADLAKKMPAVDAIGKAAKLLGRLTGAAFSLSDVYSGIRDHDSGQLLMGGLGLAGVRVAYVCPPLGIAMGAATLYGSLTLPTDSAGIDATYAQGVRNLYGDGVDPNNLTSVQADGMMNRYSGGWGVATMISDSMDTKTAAVGRFFDGVFGGHK